MSAERDYHRLPDDLPVPVDDGAAAHLAGLPVPSIRLRSTLGDRVDLAELARETLVVYVYPRTGTPGEPSPPGWDAIPGARGCTPQSCAFRDHVEVLAAHGATVVGLSSQPFGEQVEFAAREHLPYALANDSGLELQAALGLPVFDAAGMRLYRRLTLIARAGRIVHVMYPVFPPDRNAADVVAWLDRHPAAERKTSPGATPARDRRR